MGPIRTMFTKLRRRRRRLKATRAEKREATATVRRLRSAVRSAEQGSPHKADLTRDLLAARAERDALEDRARARRARVRRAAARLRRLRGRKSSDLITRAEWGAQAPRGSYTRQSTLVGRVQHHTANPALSDRATIAEESARMRSIQASHFAEGWTDIGYCRVTFPSGRVYEGRPPEFVGAHTLGYNTGRLGASMDGNFELDQPTVKAIAAQRRAWQELGAGGLPIVGHYQLNPTACPGTNLKPHVQSL